MKHPLVLLHGWGVNASIWDRIIPLLEPGFELTVIDLPGYGSDVDYSGEYSLDAIANEVLSRAPVKATWVGWSLGGTIAMAAAIARPERFMKLQLVSSTPHFLKSPDWQLGVEIGPFESLNRDFDEDYDSAIKKFLLLQILTHDRIQFKRSKMLVRELTNTLIQTNRPSPRTLQMGLQILRQTDLRPRLSELAVETQIIAGQTDHVVPSAASKYLFGQLANTHSFHEFPTGHLPFLEASGKYIEVLTTFTNSTP